ncbi:hypothetical protein GQ600_16582 [Phytophthora cactorum]|nr:hypothetical protein GQ600_16582 [Phytophthora cactorum]
MTPKRADDCEATPVQGRILTNLVVNPTRKTFAFLLSSTDDHVGEFVDDGCAGRRIAKVHWHIPEARVKNRPSRVASCGRSNDAPPRLVRMHTSEQPLAFCKHFPHDHNSVDLLVSTDDNSL